MSQPVPGAPPAPGATGSSQLPGALAPLLAHVEQRLLQLWNDDPVAGQNSLDVTPIRLAEALRYAVLSPGKRIRPVLTLAAFAGARPRRRDVIPHHVAVDVACALELVHAYSLVHDDLPAMDDDDLRRGRPTMHVRYDEATAILVGDALQATAFGLIATSLGAIGRGDLVAQVVAELAGAIGAAGMVGGQFLDVAQQHARSDVAALRELHDRKTGALLAASVAIGAMLADCTAAEVENFAEFGRELGWLFQLVDDLLDHVGDTARTGKAVGRDERHDKVTALAVFGSVAQLESACDAQLLRCLQLAGELPVAGELVVAADAGSSVDAAERAEVDGPAGPNNVLAQLARFVRDRDR